MSDQPDDMVLLLLPNGGALPISRECLNDALDQAGPIREYLAEVFREHSAPRMEPPPTDNDWLKTEPIRGSGR